MISGPSNTISLVVPSWRTSPLTVSHSVSDCGSRSSAAVTTPGPSGQNPSKGLAADPLALPQLHVTPGHVIGARVAEHGSEGVLGNLVACRAADHDRELDLPVQLGRRRRVVGDGRLVADLRRRWMPFALGDAPALQRRQCSSRTYSSGYEPAIGISMHPTLPRRVCQTYPRGSETRLQSDGPVSGLQRFCPLVRGMPLP